MTLPKRIRGSFKLTKQSIETLVEICKKNKVPRERALLVLRIPQSSFYRNAKKWGIKLPETANIGRKKSGRPILSNEIHFEIFREISWNPLLGLKKLSQSLGRRRVFVSEGKIFSFLENFMKAEPRRNLLSPMGRLDYALTKVSISGTHFIGLDNEIATLRRSVSLHEFLSKVNRTSEGGKIVEQFLIRMDLFGKESWDIEPLDMKVFIKKKVPIFERNSDPLFEFYEDPLDHFFQFLREVSEDNIGFFLKYPDLITKVLKKEWRSNLKFRLRNTKGINT